MVLSWYGLNIPRLGKDLSHDLHMVFPEPVGYVRIRLWCRGACTVRSVHSRGIPDVLLLCTGNSTDEKVRYVDPASCN